MTRPPQPTEYPGNLPPETPGPRGHEVATPVSPRPLRREYRDPLHRPYSGEVWVFSNQVRVLTLPLVDGVLETALLPGTYHLVAELWVDGYARYQDEDVTL